MPTNQPPLNPKILKVTVRNRQKAVYDEEALFVQSVNEKGDFAVLGEHTNFISIVKNQLIIGKTDKTNNKIDLTEQAILKVRDNVVEVYLGLTEGSEKEAQKPQPTPTTKPASPSETVPKK